MRFVNKNLHSVAVCEFDNRLHIRAYAIVCRVIYKNSNGIGVFFNGFSQSVNVHAESNAYSFVNIGVYINRLSTTENEGVKNTLMNISWKDNLILRFTGSKNHCLNR